MTKQSRRGEKPIRAACLAGRGGKRCKAVQSKAVYIKDGKANQHLGIISHLGP